MFAELGDGGEHLPKQALLKARRSGMNNVAERLFFFCLFAAGLIKVVQWMFNFLETDVWIKKLEGII